MLGQFSPMSAKVNREINPNPTTKLTLTLPKINNSNNLSKYYSTSSMFDHNLQIKK